MVWSQQYGTADQLSRNLVPFEVMSNQPEPMKTVSIFRAAGKNGSACCLCLKRPSRLEMVRREFDFRQARYGSTG